MAIGNASIPAQGPARPAAARLSERGLMPAVMQLPGPANWWLPRRAGRAPASPATGPDRHDLADGPGRTWPATRDQLVQRR
jgi:hypothetical protein